MKQPTLFDNRPTLTQRVLSLLLWHANSDPPAAVRYSFYRIKDRVLRKYGSLDGERRIDWQDVSSVCWSCEGTGGLYEPGGCWKCRGTGIHRSVFVPLSRWKIAGRVFHVPGPATSVRPETIEVKGYIRHEASKRAWLCALVLAGMFDHLTFRVMLRDVWPWPQLRQVTGRVRRLVRKCLPAGRDSLDDLPF